MDIQVNNFRGIADLHTPLKGVLLLTGDNGAGKSSACSAIAMAACGALLPEGVTKKTAMLLVKDGEDRATVVLTTETGSASVTWPAVERSTVGTFTDSSPVAVGLRDLTAEKAADRAAYLIALLDAKPTTEQVKAELKRLGVPEEWTAGVVKELLRGWDAAHNAFKELATKAKGQWEKTTGERYGATKALGWRPKGWAHRLELETASSLERACIEGEEALAGVQRRMGANTAEAERLRALAEPLPRLLTAMEEAQAEVERAAADLATAKAALAALPPKPVLDAAPLHCPCCGGVVRLEAGVLVEDKAYSQREMDERRYFIAQHDEAASVVKKAHDRVALAETYAQAADRKHEAAWNARDKLANLAAGDATAEELKAATENLADLRALVAMKAAVTTATALCEKISRAGAVADMLASDGLRLCVLVDKLADFNADLVEICKLALWKPVHIDANMGLSHGGRPAILCSAAEQYRVKVALQLAVALRERAPLVVIDGADILDRPGRNGLIRMLARLEIQAVVGMTILKREEMPNLEPSGIGRSMWIAGGVAA